MLNQLLESRARRQRRPGGTFVSITAHALVIGALVQATAHAAIVETERPKDPTITFIDDIKTPPPPPPVERMVNDALNAASGRPRADLLAPELIPPINIPNAIPDIDFSRAPTNPDDFASGRRRSQGGVPGGTGNAKTGDVYLENQVERPVAVLPGTRGPDYPDALRQAGVEGQVLVQFVVDTLGRVQMSTLEVLGSDHAFFTSAVKRSLEKMRFLPAEVGQRKVPQWVVQPFQFKLNRI